MSDGLQTVTDVLASADRQLRAGHSAAAHAWSTGFDLLDTYLGGGLRGGELILLGGPQGLGKTAITLQMARHAASYGGSAVVFSFEHDAATLIERLITIEAADLLGLDGIPLRRVREAMEAGGTAAGTLEERLSVVPGAGAEAVAALRGYGDQLLLHRSMGAKTDLAAIREVVDASIGRTGRLPVVVVDYLQKVFVPAGGDEDERVTTIVEGLKDLALDMEIPVLAVVAADTDGIATGKRLRPHHLRGSSALAYEADVVLLLNDKRDVVARHHLMYDVTAAERYRSYVVLTIEKNRSGMDKVDLQLRKRFEQSRFDTDAEPVPETLVDERVFTD